MVLVTSLPNASAAKKDGSLLEIVDSGPMEDVRGFDTGNSDNTFFPGDFFSITADVAPDGHHGGPALDEVKRYYQIEKPEINYWYRSINHIVKTGETLDFENREGALSAAKNRANDRSNWDNARAKETGDSPTPWEGFYDKHMWKVRKLKLNPLVRTYVTGPTVAPPGDIAPIEREDSTIEVKEGEETTVETGFKVQKGAPPGVYTAHVVFPVPEGGHNNPHENATPVIVDENFRVVKYEPKLWQIPYLELNWKRGATNWMSQKPNSIVTRYDGSENSDNAADLDRRAIASAVSVSGSMNKPLHANGMFPRLRDGVPYLNEENARHRLNLGENITLAKKPDGSYYESGALVSPVMDMGEDVENNEWGMMFAVRGQADSDEWTTPSGTNVRIVMIASDTNQTSEAGILQGEVGPRSEGRYIQYFVILYTRNDSNTPVVDRIELETHEYTPFDPPEGDWERHVIQKSWYRGGEDFLSPEIVDFRPEREGVRFRMELENYFAVREPEMYHEGDVLREKSGLPRTAKIPLKPLVDNNERVTRGHFCGTSHGHAVEMDVRVEEAKDRLKEGVLERTDTLEGAPSFTFIWFISAAFTPSEREAYVSEAIHREDQWVFPFEKGYFVYGPSNRYKKWETFWYPYSSRLGWNNSPDGPPRSRIRGWYEDVEVNARIRFWFHQKVSNWSGGATHSAKPVFTSDLTWGPTITYQPVEVGAWELKDGLENEVLEEPSMVLQDNVWKVDGDVEFDLTFTGMNDPENFLKMSHRAAKRLAPMMSAGNGEIRKIDPATGDTARSFKFPELRPRGLAWSEGYLWCAGRGSDNAGDETIYKLNLPGGDVVRTISPPGSRPSGVAWDGHHLWVADEREGVISKIDPSDGSVVKTIGSPGPSPLWLAWGDNGLWSMDEWSDNIYRLRPSDESVVQTVSLPDLDSLGTAWGNQHLWVADKAGPVAGNDRIRKVDPRTENVVGSLALPSSSPSALAWGGQHLWAAIPGSETGFEGSMKGMVGNENFRERMAEMGLSMGEEDVEGVRESLLALASMDNRMMDMILEDWVIENAGPQIISGTGRVFENIKYRIGGYYAVSENVVPPGENRKEIVRAETAKLPFNPDENAGFDINVTGEGLVAEVGDDGPRQAKIKIYAPSKAGGIKGVVLRDDKGRVLAEKDFSAGAFGWLPDLSSIMGGGEGDSEIRTLSYVKWENSPTHLEIEMTNEWGATVKQELVVSPEGETAPWEANTNLRWLVLAALGIVAWTSFVRWWKEIKGGRVQSLKAEFITFFKRASVDFICLFFVPKRSSETPHISNLAINSVKNH